MHKMTSDGIVLKYQGAITTEVIDPLLSVVRHRLECIEPNINLQKKVYTILMECAQNIYLHANHSTAGKPDRSGGYISIESNREGYTIISANLIPNEKRATLTDILEDINRLGTQEDLRNLYNKVMSNKKFSNRGGGGLGLIDVARKTSGKLTYTIDVMDNEYSFFTLYVAIKK